MIKIIIAVCSFGGSSLQDAKAGGSPGELEAFPSEIQLLPPPPPAPTTTKCAKVQNPHIFRCHQRLKVLPNPALPGSRAADGAWRLAKGHALCQGPAERSQHEALVPPVSCQAPALRASVCVQHTHLPDVLQREPWL